MANKVVKTLQPAALHVQTITPQISQCITSVQLSSSNLRHSAEGLKHLCDILQKYSIKSN